LDGHRRVAVLETVLDYEPANVEQGGRGGADPLHKKAIGFTGRGEMKRDMGHKQEKSCGNRYITFAEKTKKKKKKKKNKKKKKKKKKKKRRRKNLEKKFVRGKQERLARRCNGTHNSNIELNDGKKKNSYHESLGLSPQETEGTGRGKGGGKNKGKKVRNEGKGKKDYKNAVPMGDYTAELFRPPYPRFSGTSRETGGGGMKSITREKKRTLIDSVTEKKDKKGKCGSQGVLSEGGPVLVKTSGSVAGWRLSVGDGGKHRLDQRGTGYRTKKVRTKNNIRSITILRLKWAGKVKNTGGRNAKSLRGAFSVSGS